MAFRALGGLPGASVVPVGAVLLLLLSVVSGRGLVLLPWLHFGLFVRHTIPAPRYQLYLHCVAPCRAHGGCRTPVSVSGALVAQGAM